MSAFTTLMCRANTLRRCLILAVTLALTIGQANAQTRQQIRQCVYACDDDAGCQDACLATRYEPTLPHRLYPVPVMPAPPQTDPMCMSLCMNGHDGNAYNMCAVHCTR